MPIDVVAVVVVEKEGVVKPLRSRPRCRGPRRRAGFVGAGMSASVGGTGMDDYCFGCCRNSCDW